MVVLNGDQSYEKIALKGHTRINWSHSWQQVALIATGQIHSNKNHSYQQVTFKATGLTHSNKSQSYKEVSQQQVALLPTGHTDTNR